MNQTNQNRHTRKKPTFYKRGLPVRDRGSLLILCVTILVIIALIGIAFLQRVRMDRFAIANHDRNYMNLVINGILEDVKVQMKEDVKDPATGRVYSSRLLYDYPWTKEAKNVDAEFNNGTRVPVNGSGTGAPGSQVSDHKDDRWLASTAPVYVPSTRDYRWLHLTNMDGLWLDLESGTELPIDGKHGQILRSDTDIPLDQLQDFNLFGVPRREPLGVDADGDGVADSRWQWTPKTVRDLGGRKFVMSLRIVDLNSMLNLNTATALTEIGSPAGGSPRIARGHNPSWVDLSRLFRRIDNYNGEIRATNWASELTEVLSLRGMDGAIIPNVDFTGTTSLTPNNVQRLWEKQGSIYGNTDRNFAIESELDLRSLGGINDSAQNSTLEGTMGLSYRLPNEKFSKLLRQHPAIVNNLGPELAYPNVVGIGPTVNAAISRWFYGDKPSSPTDDGDKLPVIDRRFRAIRHFLTTASGTGVYAPRYGGSGDEFKFDLNRDWAGGTPQDLNDLRRQIESVFFSPNFGTPDPNKYLGATEAFLRDLVVEYVVAIKDYSDPDSNPTQRVMPGGGTAYGMEKLPFIREVYFHQLYEDQNLLGIDGTNPIDVATNPDDFIFDTLVAKPGTRGVVIELGNPFSHEILGEVLNGGTGAGARGLIRVVIEQGGSVVSTWEYSDTAPTKNIGPRNDANDGDTLLLVSNQTAPDLDGSGAGGDIEVDMNLNSALPILELTDGSLTFTVGGGPITIRLEVDTTGAGNYVAYDRFVTRITFRPTRKHDPSSTPFAAVPQKYIQSSAWRNGDKINFVADGTGTGRFKTPDDLNAPPAFINHRHHLASSNKNPLTPPSIGLLPDSMQLPLPDRPMRSLAEIGWVHMFGFTDRLTFPERMAMGGPSGIPIEEHFLLIDPTHVRYRVTQAPPLGVGLPHAAMLMDVLTTVSPAKDGRDNDNDDGDNDPTTSRDNLVSGQRVELFTPGTINVNTAPLHVLTLGSPLGESLNSTESLMRTIVAYRDEPIRSPQGHGDYWGATPFNDVDMRVLVSPGGAVIDRLTKNDPGIASLGELLFLNPVSGSLPTVNSPYDMQRYGIDGNPTFPAGTKLDMYPDPSDTTANGASVNQGDENEQRLARFGMLSQALTVRSDRYVVYGVVRGYEYDEVTRKFKDLLEPTARFLAIIDRSSMAIDTDNPRVIGFIRLQ